jgi:two-component system phosphate regulon sensor histidine kinase PhoR
MAIWFFLTIILLLSVTFFVYAILIILQQKRFSEMQKDFIGNMAHEFKTPLTTIGISSDTLISSGSQADPQRMEKYGTIIRQESRRLNMLVEKLLQVARLENRKIQLKREMIDLNALVATIADNFRESNDQSRQLEAELDPGTGFVSADIVHLTSILYNLIDNAIKYAGERPRVRIATTRDTGKVRLTVSDNGPGIDPRYRHKVFEKFFRIPSGDRHDVKGFGLGLYYVKILCRAHGWNIRLTGGPSGNGAAFTVEMTGKS